MARRSSKPWGGATLATCLAAGLILACTNEDEMGLDSPTATQQDLRQQVASKNRRHAEHHRDRGHHHRQDGNAAGAAGKGGASSGTGGAAPNDGGLAVGGSASGNNDSGSSTGGKAAASAGAAGRASSTGGAMSSGGSASMAGGAGPQGGGYNGTGGTYTGVCANGVLEGGEQCDDGNAVAGDGCAPSCVAEFGYACWSGTCHQVICGDGVYEPFGDGEGGYRYESCEDGNTLDGDGCSATCETEVGWNCGSGTCHRVVCGDGITECAESGLGVYLCEGCDDGNAADGDGCTASCAIEPGWACIQGEACRRPFCGDGFADAWYDETGVWRWEECDDGNAADGDGCSSSCTITPGWICPTPGDPCHTPTCGDGYADSWSDESGNWYWEECDDGNAVPGDGCSDTCVAEPGWICPAPDEPCRQPACGDGYEDWWTDSSGLWQWEECDDGNTDPDDGCSPACSLEAGWYRSENGFTRTTCGNLLLECGSDGNRGSVCEQCEDGNPESGDGCSASCMIETGWICEAEGTSCRRVVCGDGLLDCIDYQDGTYLCEECEDGNATSGDGCTASCAAEQGWNCWSGTCYQVVCGDGMYDCFSDGTGNYACESCEDGNTQSGDGCTASCLTEAGYNCDTAPCHRVVCGDGRTECSQDDQGIYTCEECDDANAVAGDGCTNCRMDAPPPGTGGVFSGGAGPGNGGRMTGTGGVGGRVPSGGRSAGGTAG